MFCSSCYFVVSYTMEGGLSYEYMSALLPVFLFRSSSVPCFRIVLKEILKWGSITSFWMGQKIMVSLFKKNQCSQLFNFFSLIYQTYTDSTYISFEIMCKP